MSVKSRDTRKYNPQTGPSRRKSCLLSCLGLQVSGSARGKVVPEANRPKGKLRFRLIVHTVVLRRPKCANSAVSSIKALVILRSP